jgi:hypothetical protein
MATLSNVYFKLETLETLVSALKKKGESGVGLTISTNDTGDAYNQNVSVYVSQSKDDRDAKKPRFYVANGNVNWTDGKVTVMKKESTKVAEPIASDDTLPF